jgi:hypothetical protein
LILVRTRAPLVGAGGRKRARKASFH